MPSSTHRLAAARSSPRDRRPRRGSRGRPTAAAPATAAPAAAPSRTATPDNYTPPPGVRFNNPLGSEDSRRNIIRHLIRTIDSVPKKEQIHIASWNVRSDAIIDALIRAHVRRKVSVRVVMDRLNANPTNPNFGVNRLENALKIGNGKRKQANKSFPAQVRQRLPGPARHRAHEVLPVQQGRHGPQRHHVRLRQRHRPRRRRAVERPVHDPPRRHDLRRVRQRVQGDDQGHQPRAAVPRLHHPEPAVHRVLLPLQGRGHREGPGPQRAQPRGLRRRDRRHRHQRAHQDPDRDDLDARRARHRDRQPADADAQPGLRHQDRLRRVRQRGALDLPQQGPAADARSGRSPRTSPATASTTATCT